MEIISHPNLVYRDESTKQLVTNSYKMYKAFGLNRHNDIVNAITLSLDTLSHYDLNRSENSIILNESTIISDRGIKMNGYILNNKGFNLIMMALRLPHDIERRGNVFKAQIDFINAFHDMKELITNCLITLPTDDKDLKQLEADIKSGSKRFRRGSYINTPTNWKPLDNDSEVLKRLNKVSSYFFDSFDAEMEEFAKKIEND